MLPLDMILGIILQAQSTACFGMGEPVGWYHAGGDSFVVRCSHGHTETVYVCDYEPAFCDCGVLVKAGR